MEKKFYEIPEIAMIDMNMELPLMAESDVPQVIDGEGDAENSGLGD